MNKKRSKDLSELGGMVYSTNSDFDFNDEPEDEAVLANNDQRLRVLTDKKQRKGKIVTLVEGFVGPLEALNDLAKQLKTLCGTGGSAKEGVVLIQGDFKMKIGDHLKKQGYSIKILS